MQNEQTASYVFKLTADSGYESEQSGIISPDEYGAVVAVLECPDILQLVVDAIAENNKESNVKLRGSPASGRVPLDRQVGRHLTTENEMANTAYLSWSVDIDCPKCGNENDITRSDDDNIISNAIFNNNWDALKGYEATCYMCGHDFIVDKIEY